MQFNFLNMVIDINLILISDNTMNMHFEQIATQSKVLQTYSGFVMHQFVQKVKSKVAEGNCLILDWHKQQDTSSLFYLKMNNFDFCKRINDSIFIKITYLKSTSYIFFNEFQENLVYAISLQNISAELRHFQQFLIERAKLIDYLSPELKYETKVRIDYHIDNVKENEIILNYNKLAKISKAFGGFFGKINKAIVEKTAKAQVTIQSNITRFSRESFSEQTRSKWDSFKQKASQFNDKITTLVQPINQSISAVATSIGQKYNNSTNQYIKSLREITKQAQDSINQGFAEPQTQVKMEGEGVLKQPMNDTGMQMLQKKHNVLNEQVTPNNYPQL